jgi:uncharacterized repeat protein (TIGR04076 family)
MPKAKRLDTNRRDGRTQTKKNEKPSCPISRREFCKSVPYTVVGGFSLSCLMKPLGTDISTVSSKESEKNEEEIMANKIIAVTAKVLSQKGTCAFHEVGDKVKFTESGVEGKICIHALYSMLPAVFAMMFEARFPWLRENPDKKTHACPDAYNPVVFEIERIREQ